MNVWKRPKKEKEAGMAHLKIWYIRLIRQFSKDPE